jgi:hypothetical protein
MPSRPAGPLRLPFVGAYAAAGHRRLTVGRFSASLASCAACMAPRILRCVRADHGGTAIIIKAIHAAASSARFA